MASLYWIGDQTVAQLPEVNPPPQKKKKKKKKKNIYDEIRISRITIALDTPIPTFTE